MKAMLDAAIINFSLIFAYYLRFKVFVFITPGSAPIFSQYAGTLIFITILWLAIFKLFGLYEKKAIGIIDELALLFSSVTFSSLLLLGMLFLYRSFWFSRLVIVNAWVISFVLLLLLRLIFYVIKRMMLVRGIGANRVLIVGAGEMGQTIALRLLKDKSLGGIPIAFLDDDPSKEHRTVEGIEVKGGTLLLKKFINDYSIDEIIFAANSMPYNKILDLITDCETLRVKFKIVPGFLELMASRVNIDEVGGVPLITVSEIGLVGFNAFIKRSFDIIFSSMLLLILLPLFLIVAILIKIDSKGPVFFLQKRVGKDGRIFYMFKFRSMFTDAEKLFETIKEKSEVEGYIFKIKKDPRITRVGKWIRRFSIDELPQLLNVLVGQMSLVGPRPPIPREVANYSPWHHKRLRITPGVTGLWQVSGRSLLPFEDMVRLDIYYIENWSLWNDFKILCRTIPVVLTGSGAF